MPFFFHRSPRLLKAIYPEYLWKVPTDAKEIFLTFDDGPIPEVTDFALKTLDDYNAKATFFCIGDNIRKHPSVFESVVTAGHSVGNHTFNHLNGWKTDTNTYVENYFKCQKMLGESGTCLFRPPYGRITKHEYKSLPSTTRVIMWDVLTGDYSPNIKKEDCLRKTIKHSKEGSIVVFHDSLKAKRNMMYVLPKLLDHMTSLGYSFNALPEESL